MPRFLLHTPAHLINGISVALGVATVQILVGALGGFVAALTASSGAILASLADTPNAPWRTWRRVSTAASVGFVATLAVTLVKPFPAWMGLATLLLAFLSALALAWGPRAGPVSFVPILALVFTLAAPVQTGWGDLVIHCAWTALGAALYLGWAVACSTLLQPRLRTLALATAIGATSELLRSRAGLMRSRDPLSALGELPLQSWIQGQAALDERLQNARDLLFAPPQIGTETPAAARVQRQIAVLLLAIDLRDNLLASEVDIDLLAHDAPAQQVAQALSTNLHEMADALDRIGAAIQFDTPYSAGKPLGDALQFEAAPSGRGASPLVQALLNRARNMIFDLGRMQAAMVGEAITLPLDRRQLQLFVSPEGWPLATVKTHLTLASPVMRHALRVGFALGSAYYIAEALPWASHPHWLVLSVGVVLRGNLEQTLARRDSRIAGTTIGCLLVALLARFATPEFSTLIFIVAVGVAHSFVLRRYLLTAIAATLMALLQARLVHPIGGYGVGERLADTILGALLAWGFSYMLPWWERRGIATLVPRVLKGLGTLSVEALRWPDPEASDLQLRLARRSVYEAISSIAATAQRTVAEPHRVRVPLYALAGLLTQSHVLLAHLAAIRTLLTRRATDLHPDDAQAALEATSAQLTRLLAVGGADPSGPQTMPLSEIDMESLPASTESLTPWLRRRLQMTCQAAARVAEAARALLAAVG